MTAFRYHQSNSDYMLFFKKGEYKVIYMLQTITQRKAIICMLHAIIQRKVECYKNIWRVITTKIWMI